MTPMPRNADAARSTRAVDVSSAYILSEATGGATWLVSARFDPILSNLKITSGKTPMSTEILLDSRTIAESLVH
jgi:hypothetical protein